MTSSIEKGFSQLSDLNLWLKIKLNESILLSDMPAVIKIRYPYIVENWGFIKQTLINRLNSYQDPYRLQNEIKSFDSLVKAQLAGATTTPSETTLLFKYYCVFDALSLNEVRLSKPEYKILESETNRIKTFIKSDFIKIRSDLIKARDQIADNIGGTDSDYNKTYSRSSVRQTFNKNINDIKLTSQFQQGIYLVEAVLSNQNIIKSSAAIDPFAFARQNANNPNFNIGQYSSGRLVRMRYNETLQQLAERTLGNPDLWYDIAIANGLKPPYIDEIGVKIPLITNGNKNRINIAQIGPNNVLNRDRFYLNQIVLLQSDAEKTPEQRIVRSILEIPISGQLVIELSGEEDLDKYRTQDNSHVRVFAPQTINSNFFVLIPSTEPVNQALIQNTTPWFLRSKSEDEKRAGVDLYVNEDGDINFTPTGDIQLSYGAANAMQALLLLLSTEISALTRHPDYGVSYPLGQKNTDIAIVRQNIAETIASQVLRDGRFDRLKTLTVELLDGASGYKVFLEVVLAGGQSVIPISFSISTNID